MRSVFAARLLLAATLSANYGIYGPAFELMESAPARAGHRGIPRLGEVSAASLGLRFRLDSLWPLIARVNRIRRCDNVALQSDRSLEFCHIDNEQLIGYLPKHDSEAQNIVLTIVNLDPYNTQSGWLQLDLARLGLQNDRLYQVHDLLTDQRYPRGGGRTTS